MSKTPRTDTFHAYILRQDECEAENLLAYQLHAETLEKELAQAKADNARLREEIQEREAMLRFVMRERDDALNVIGQTRAASTYAMDEIRAALGVPSGAEDKSSNRAVDYVRKQTADNARLREEVARRQEDGNRMDWLEQTADGINWQMTNTERITRDSIDAARASLKGGAS